MNILVLGSGGREHAFVTALAKTDKVYCAPGNAGTMQQCTNLDLNPEDAQAVYQAVTTHQIDLVVVGPEAPLVAGVVDALKDKVAIIGPDANGARLEGSKAFSKAFMQQHGIPTAAYREFTAGQLAEAEAWVDAQPFRVVVKADGLAAGKGVVVAQDAAEAKDALRHMLQDNAFGSAGSRVVAEQYLDGIEMSVFVLTDGKGYTILPEAKDYKRIGEEDTGPNTGGMGSVSPVPFATPALMAEIEETIVKPTVKGINDAGWHYRGFVFIGLMIVEGKPYVLEYNVRMGDPETQSVLSRLQSPLSELLMACWRQQLSTYRLQIDPRTAVTVVLASQGYPGSYEKGHEISGLNRVQHALVYHAGTATTDNMVVTAGGRVLAITALGKNLEEARATAIEAAGQVIYHGRYFRTDIGTDLLKLSHA